MNCGIGMPRSSHVADDECIEMILQPSERFNLMERAMSRNSESFIHCFVPEIAIVQCNGSSSKVTHLSDSCKVFPNVLVSILLLL